MTSDDDYFYPGTSTLKNLRDIPDRDGLRQFEEETSLLRMAEMLSARPVSGEFDQAHVKAIHRFVFGDVYDWAGCERREKSGLAKYSASPRSILAGDFTAPDMHEYRYAVAGPGMRTKADEGLAELPAIEIARRMTPKDFAAAIARPWAKLNHAHLFREGNTRTQVVFFAYFARACGQPFDVDRFTRDSDFRAWFNAGRFLYQADGNTSVLREALTEIIVPDC